MLRHQLARQSLRRKPFLTGTASRHASSDVNKDLTFKAKDKDKDQTLKAKDQDKD